jgi:SOS-response transcriptional repressor LexA
VTGPPSVDPSWPPTERQREVLEVVARGIHNRRAIAAAIGVRSTNAVMDHLLSLAKRGLVDWEPKTVSAIRITAQGLRLLGPCGCVRTQLTLGVLARDADRIWIEAGGGRTSIVFCPWCGRRLSW